MIINQTKVDKDTIRVEVDDKVVGFVLRLDNMWRPYKADLKTPIVGGAFFSLRPAVSALVAYGGHGT